MKFKASHLVVDADVARAASLTEKPVSSSARTVLITITESNLKVAFSAELNAEWKKHASRFTLQWLANMVARRKVVRVNPASLTLPEIEKSPLPESDKAISSKDAHLLDIALECDRCIISNDKTARQVFCLLSEHTPLLNEVIWVVPTDHAPALAALLREGGFAPAPWYLSAGAGGEGRG